MKNMCNFWTCLLDREGKVVWDKNGNSHEKLIEKTSWKDDKLENRDFVRIEINPKNLFSKNKKDWSFKVDEKGTLPLWFSENRAKMEEACWKEWKVAMKRTLWKFHLKNLKKTIQKIKKIPYFSMKGKINAEWNLSLAPTWDAARVAAGNAARVAARDTGNAGNAARDAGNAVWDAAGNAARDAGNAVWDAAGNAAKDAVWDVAWVAAGDTRNAWNAVLVAARDAVLFIRCLVSLNFGLDKKHFLHAKARMEVWEAGYALYCDVDGKLFVYGIEKTEG